MRYLAVAMNLDGTLMVDGRIDASALAALTRLRASGRRVVLVTSRRLAELSPLASSLALFDCIAAENGALLHWPSRRESSLLCRPVEEPFIAALRSRGVSPLERGQATVSTRAAHACALVETVGALGLELQVIFAGERVLAVPAGASKGAGLREALVSLGLSTHEVVSLGRGANDHSLLDVSECAVAAADAVPALRQRADLVLRGAGGAAVVELAEAVVQHDLQEAAVRLTHDALPLGTDAAGEDVCIPAYGSTLLVIGPRDGAAHGYVQGFLERLLQKRYQPCVIDPVGDFRLREDMVKLGSRLSAPRVKQVLAALADPSVKLVVSLAHLPPEEQPDFCAELLRALEAQRLRTGRPHWILVPGAERVWPSTLRDAPRLRDTLLQVEEPAKLARAILGQVDIAVGTGPAPARALQRLATALGTTALHLPLGPGGDDALLAWFVQEEHWPQRLRAPSRSSERARRLPEHVDGDLGARGFVFRGPEGRLALRAPNLGTFCRLAVEVDERTWVFHLWHGDYSRWVRDVLRDDALSRRLSAIERRYELSAQDSRRAVCGAIAHRYALTA